MSFLRARQRAITGVFPHQANPTHIMPNHRAGPQLLTDVYTVTTITLTFDEEVTGGDSTGWEVTANGVPLAITSVLNGITDDIIIVTHALAVIADVMVVRYTPKLGGAQWKGATSGIFLDAQFRTGVIPP